MLRALVLALVLAGDPDRAPAPFVRVDAGAARLAEGVTVRALDRRAGTVALSGSAGRLEAGARSELTLVWRGLASATLEGPAALELGRVPRLALEQARVLELEVRRGTFPLELAGLGRLEVGSGALRVRALPHGAWELLNRGGTTLELRRQDARTFSIAAGQRVRVRADG